MRQPEFEGYMILEEPELFIDSYEKMLSVFKVIGEQAIENPGRFVIFKLNKVPDGS